MVAAAEAAALVAAVDAAALVAAAELAGAVVLDAVALCEAAGVAAELLEAAGVDTVKEFRHRVAENLVQKMQETNDAKNLVRRVPSVKQVEKMIAQAKELPPVMKY